MVTAPAQSCTASTWTTTGMRTCPPSRSTLLPGDRSEVVRPVPRIRQGYTVSIIDHDGAPTRSFYEFSTVFGNVSYIGN